MESMKRWAARQGPRVCELEGPMPILKMSNTEMDSCGKNEDLSKDRNPRVQKKSDKVGFRKLACGKVTIRIQPKNCILK